MRLSRIYGNDLTSVDGSGSWWRYSCLSSRWPRQSAACAQAALYECEENHVYLMQSLTPSLTAAVVLALIAAAPSSSHARQAGVSGTVMALAKRCAPNVHPLTMAYLVTVESSSNRFAIGVNGGYRLPRRPANEREAMETIRWLQAHGYNFDVGYGQVNSSNFDRLGLTGESLLDGCTTLC